MKKIYIIRHAKSNWDFPELNDLVRPLSERGKVDIKKIGIYLKENNINPDYIISSPATRALHTAIEIASFTNFDIEMIDVQKQIYFGNSTQIISYIQQIEKQYNNLFLFGHEPTLSSLIEKLTNISIEKFPTCAVFGINFEIDNWEELNYGTKHLFIYPKLF